ncbi:MAG: hypothetical protein ACI80L_000116 [Pseudohongiellaceae bacterium]|jgi:hypothetical protein
MTKVDVILSIVSEPTTGYTRASNGEGSDINCYYKFTGGTDGNGNVIVTTMGQRTNIVVILAPDGTKNEYDIVTGFWKGDPVAKMRFEIPGPNRLKIIDDADVIDDVAYSVVVTPQKGPRRLILCDPRVANSWGSSADNKKKKKAAKSKAVKKKGARKGKK